MGLKSNDWCPYSRRENAKRHRREGSDVKAEAEIGMKPPQARNSQGPSKLEEAGRTPLEPLESAWPCQRLDFRLPASRTMREYISLMVLFSHPVCGDFYGSLGKLRYPASLVAQDQDESQKQGLSLGPPPPACTCSSRASWLDQVRRALKGPGSQAIVLV